MSPTDSQDDILRLLEESPGVDTETKPPTADEIIQSERELAIQNAQSVKPVAPNQDILDLLEQAPTVEDTVSEAMGSFNKTLSLSNDQLAAFSNPPTALEIASSPEPPPFVARPALRETMSIEQLLEYPDSSPVSAEIIPENAQLQVEQKPIEPSKSNLQKAGEFGLNAAGAAMKGFDSVFTSALDAYAGLSVSKIGVEQVDGYNLPVLRRNPKYDIKKTWAYKQARQREIQAANTYRTTPGFEETFPGQVAKGLGQSAGIMVTGGMMGAAPKLVGATAVRPLITSATTGAVISGGASLKQALEQGATDDQALRFAALNAIVGTSEAIPLAGWMDKLDGATGGAFSRGFTGYLKEVVKEGSEEFTQEMMQTFFSNWFEQQVYNPDKDLLEDVKESAQVGGASGLIASAFINALGLRLRGGKTQASKDQIPNAPQTSEVLNDLASKVEKEFQPKGLRPLTEGETAEEDLIPSEEIPVDDFLPIPIGGTTTNEQESPTPQEEKAATPSDEASGPKYGEQVLRRVAQPAGEGQTASPYDVDDPELTGAGLVQPDLTFNKPGRPRTKDVDTGLEAQKPLAVDQELPATNDPEQKIDTGLEAQKPLAVDQELPENKRKKKILDPREYLETGLFGDIVGSGEPQYEVDQKYKRSLDYAADYYAKSLRDEYLSKNYFTDAKLVFPESLKMNEFAKDIVKALQQAELPIPEDAVGQMNFFKELRRQILAIQFKKPEGAAISVVKAALDDVDDELGEVPQVETDVPQSVAQALQNLNVSFARAQENRPEPIKRVPRSPKNGSRVSSEIRFSEESPDYMTALNEFPEAPNEDTYLSEAENFFRRNAANLKNSRPNLTVDASRIANAARMKYWRQLRRKYNIRKNAEGVSEKEAQETFEAIDAPSISKSRIFRSVVEDYSEKLGRRIGGNIGLESADSLQRALGDDDGSETLEDRVEDRGQNLDETEVRQDLLKNARNAYFESIRGDGPKAYLLASALNDAVRTKKDPAEFAKNTTELSKIAGIFNQQGMKTSTGELAKMLPKLVEEFKNFVKNKRDTDYDNFQKTGQLPDVVPGMEKTFNVLAAKRGPKSLTDYDKKMQALARSQLNILEDGDFITPVEAAVVRDKLDMSPRSGAAIRAIEEMRAILAEKQPGVGLTEPVVSVVSAGNPANVPSVTPDNFKLLAHQREGSDLLFNAYKEGRRGMLLADDAGLGKTRTAQSAARIIADDRAKARGETYGKVVVITESNELIDAAKGGLKNQLASANIPRNRFQFYTYDAYSKGLIKGIETADVIIFDEAQNLKNTSTNRARMAKNLNAIKIFVTATPSDRLSGIMYFLPEVLGKSEATVRAMLDTSLNKPETIFSALDSASTVGAYIRRIPDSPKPAARLLELEAGPEVISEIGQIIDYYANQISDLNNPAEASTIEGREKTLKLEAMVKYKTEAWLETQKADYIFERAIEDIRAGKQVVIFGEFVNQIAFPELGIPSSQSLLQSLNDRFTRAGLNPAVLYGEGGNQMTSDINDFQSGIKKVLLATPTKGGTGLSLDDQVGNAVRVVYIATPNEAADKHEQMLHRAGHRVSSKSIPEIYEVVATDVVTDTARLKVRDRKQSTLEASQGIGGDSDGSQLNLGFEGQGRRIDRNTIAEIPIDQRPLRDQDSDSGSTRRPSIVRNGQKVDERFSRLPVHQQQIVDEFTKALSDLKFKDVKVLFGDVAGNMSAWVSRKDSDNNTIYINPEILHNNKTRLVRSNRGRINNFGQVYLTALASEEMMHNSLFRVIRKLANELHADRIKRKQITAQEAYVETMDFMLKKAHDEISQEAKTALRAQYGRELSEEGLTIEYLRRVHQKARLGYTTEDVAVEANQEELVNLLKDVPKDGYLAAWFKFYRQALYDLLAQLGITIQDNPFISNLVDATDNILFLVEKNGKSKKTDRESVNQLIELASPETAGQVRVTDAPVRVSAKNVANEQLARQVADNKRQKRKNKESIYEFGDTQVVRDAFNRGHEFVFAWVDRSKVQASHLGSARGFATNKLYTGTNQRNYSYSMDEKAKIVEIEGPSFNAAQVVTDGSGASNQGLPLLIFDKNVGMWMVVAGNGREQVFMKTLLNAATKEELFERAKKLTAEKGGEAPSDVENSNMFLYRVLKEEVDTRTEEGEARLNQLIKETNAEGGNELTHLAKAEQDYESVANDPIGKAGLMQAALEVASLTKESAQSLLAKLTDKKVLSRAERNALLSQTAGSMPVEYVQYLILRNFLTPLERHTIKGEIPGKAMATEIMDQGRGKEIFLLLAQASAAAQRLEQTDGKKYKDFLSRISNEMLKQIGFRQNPLEAFYDLKIEERDMFDMASAEGSKAFPEVAADPEFKKLIGFIYDNIQQSVVIRDGNKEYTKEAKKKFRFIVQELANSLAESAKLGQLTLDQQHPVEAAIERVKFSFSSSYDVEEFSGAGDIQVGEFAGDDDPRQYEIFERAQAISERIKAENARRRLLKQENVFKSKYEVDEYSAEEINEEANPVEDMVEEIDDDIVYQDLDIAEADQDNPEFAAQIEQLKARRGKYGDVSFQLDSEQLQIGLENLAIAQTFTGENYEEPEKLGYKSREEYNRLLTALERNGMRNYFKFKNILEAIARDDEWLAEVIEKAGQEGELRKFFADAKDLMEPRESVDAVADPVIQRLFSPLRRVVTLQKTNDSLLRAEDEALRKLVLAQKETKELQRFLTAIGDSKRTKEALEVAEKAQAAFEKFMETGVAIQDMTSTDATWNPLKKKWEDKADIAKEKKLIPIDLEYRKKLKKTVEMLRRRSIVEGTQTPGRLARIRQYRSHLNNLATEIEKVESKLAEHHAEIIQTAGETDKGSGKRLALAADKKRLATDKRKELIKEFAETEYTLNRMVRTEALLSVNVKTSNEPRKLTATEQKNLPRAIVEELKRRGAIPEFSDEKPLYETTIDWEIPENFVSVGNRTPKQISAQVVFLPTVALKETKKGWKLPSNYKGVGMITKFNTNSKAQGDYRFPVFTDGRKVNLHVAELVTGAYYEKSGEISITRNQGTQFPTIAMIQPVVPNLSVTKGLFWKDSPKFESQSIQSWVETQQVSKTSNRMRPKTSSLIKDEPLINERGESLWEFQLHPETPEFSGKKLALTTRGSRNRKIYIRARTSNEAVEKAILKLGEMGDIYYKGKWYGKNIASKTRVLTQEEQGEKNEDTPISYSQLEVRQAIRKKRMDFLLAAMAKGRQMDSAFDYVAKREVEAYLTGLFEGGTPVTDEYVTKLGLIFGFADYKGLTVTRKGLEKIQARALERMTPKTMSVVKRSSKISATGPIRDVGENLLFSKKTKTEEVPLQPTEYVVPSEITRTSAQVLLDLAMSNGVSARELAAANSLTLGKVMVGQQLLIPGTTKSVEVPNFKIPAPKMTILEIAQKFGIGAAELLKYNNLLVSKKNDQEVTYVKGEQVPNPDFGKDQLVPDFNYEPKPGDVLKIPGTAFENNLSDLILRIISRNEHTTYPQMVYKDKAPQGVRLVDKSGDIVGAGNPIFDDDQEIRTEEIPTDTYDILEVGNAVGVLNPDMLQESVDYLIANSLVRGAKTTDISVNLETDTIRIHDTGKQLTKKQVIELVFGSFNRPNKPETPLAATLASSDVVVMSLKDGNGTIARTSPEILQDEEKQPFVFVVKNLLGSTGEKITGNLITITPRKTIERGGATTRMEYYLPNLTLVTTYKRDSDQNIVYREVSNTTRTEIELYRKGIDRKYLNEQNISDPVTTSDRKTPKTPKQRKRFSFSGVGAENLATLALSRGQAIGNFASQMVRNKIPYRGKIYPDIRLLRTELNKDLNTGSIIIESDGRDDIVGSGNPFAGEERERSAASLREARMREGKLKTQGFAGQLSEDKDLSPEVNSATALRDFKYRVRTQPLRAQEMLGLIDRMGGPETVADAILSPDLGVTDEQLQGMLDPSEQTTAHFDNLVILNTLLIRQLERSAKLNPDRAEEIRAKQFALASKQANLGTSLAQGLRAFGAYTRIGPAGWLYFAKNTKQVARLRQVGLLGDDITNVKRAANEAVNTGINKALNEEEVDKIAKTIDKTINNATWAKLLIGARRISEMSQAWEKATTNTLSSILDDQLKTAKEMIALLKDAAKTPETTARLNESIAEGAAVLLQKGTPSLEAASKELGVPVNDILENLEQAQDVNDRAEEKTAKEVQEFAWSKNFGESLVTDDLDISGAGEVQPSQKISLANRTIIENVINGFIQKFEAALNKQETEKPLPKETAIGVIRRILRERVQLGSEKLVLTRSKLSQEQRKLLSLRRFRDAMRNWPSLTQAVNIVYEQLKDTVDESAYARIVEAMQAAMDQPFTKTDIKAFMTLPAFNFKQFVFNRRYMLTSNRAQVLSELAQELESSGVTPPNELLENILEKIAREHEQIVNQEYERGLRQVFGKTKNKKIVGAVKEKVGPIIKAALAGNLDENTIYGYIAKRLKLSTEDWLPSKEVAAQITKLAEEIVNDPNGPESRKAATKTLDLLDVVKKDSGVSITEAMVGQFYTNILQGIKTITVNILSPIGSAVNVASILTVRGIRERNISSLRVAMKAMPRALNNALTEAVDVLATGDTAGRMLTADKSISNRKMGRALPELLADGGLKINTNSSLGRFIGSAAEYWFGWNKKGIWPKIPISKDVWDNTFKIIRQGVSSLGGGTVRPPDYPVKTPIIQVSPTGLGVLISRLYNALDLSTTTFYSELMAALAAKDAINELQQYSDPDSVPTPDMLLSKDLASLLRLGRAIAGRGERLPEHMEGPQIIRDLQAQAKEEMGERLKPGTLGFRQQLYLSARRDRGFSNGYWNRVWNTGSAVEKEQIKRFVGEINDEAFFLGSVLAYTNPPTGFIGKLAKTLEQFTNTYPLAKLVQPFFGIVTSVYQTWLTWTGVGLLQARSKQMDVFGRGKVNKSDDMIAMQLGSGIAGLGLLLSGILGLVARMSKGDDEDEPFIEFSGSGPSDPGFKQALIDSKNWQQDSIRIGNVWFRNPNWSPTYLVFKALGYMTDYVKYEKPSVSQGGDVAMKFALAGLKSMGAGVFDVPFLSGAKTIADLTNLESSSWDRKAVGFLMKTGGSLAFGNLFNEADRKIFPEKTDRQGNTRSLTGLMAMGLGNIPFLRNFNKPLTNVLGEPMLSDGSNLPENNLDRAKQAFFNYGDIILRYRNNPDPLWEELAKKRAWVSLPDRVVRVNGVILNEEQRDDWVMKRAEVLRERLRNPSYVKDLPKRSSGEVQAEITRLTSRANRQADLEVLNKYKLWDERSNLKQDVREFGRRNVE